MIVIRIEMWPKGSAALAHEIGRMFIYNDGGTETQANYEVRVCRRGRFERSPRDIVQARGFTRVGRVEGFSRKAHNVWKLVLRSLQAAFPEERS